MLWNREHRLGHVYESSAGFTLPDGSVRSPDAAWLSQAAFEQLTEAQRQRFPPVCPAFVAEVRSSSDGLGPLRRKMEMYLANGVQAGLLLDPEVETAYVYRHGQAPEELVGFERALSAAPVLPGFAPVAPELAGARRCHRAKTPAAGVAEAAYSRVPGARSGSTAVVSGRNFSRHPQCRLCSAKPSD